MKKYQIGPVSRIPLGEGREINIDGIAIAVFRSRNGKVYASQAECPHRNGPLADGLLGGSIITCPFHSWRFNLETGTTDNGTCDIQVFPIEVDETGQMTLHMEASLTAVA